MISYLCQHLYPKSTLGVYIYMHTYVCEERDWVFMHMCVCECLGEYVYVRISVYI